MAYHQRLAQLRMGEVLPNARSRSENTPSQSTPASTTLPTPSPLRALEQDWRERRRIRLEGLIDQRKREAEELKRLKEERGKIMVEGTGPAHRRMLAAQLFENSPQQEGKEGRYGRATSQGISKDASIEGSARGKTVNIPRNPLGPANTRHPHVNRPDASLKASPGYTMISTAVTYDHSLKAGLRPSSLASQRLVTDENGSRRRQDQPNHLRKSPKRVDGQSEADVGAEDVKETIRDDPREYGHRTSEGKDGRKSRHSKEKAGRSKMDADLEGDENKPRRIDSFPLPPGMYPLSSSSRLIVYPYPAPTTSLAANPSSTTTKSICIITPTEKIHILHGGEAMVHEPIDLAEARRSTKANRSRRKQRCIRDPGDWDAGDRKRWAVADQLVDRLQKYTEQAVHHTPLGDLRIMCNHPPDIHLYYKPPPETLRPDMTLTPSQSRLLESSDPDERVKVKVVFSRSDGLLDISLYRKNDGDRFKSRRAIEFGADVAIDNLLAENESIWDKVEMQAVAGLMKLRTLWAAND